MNYRLLRYNPATDSYTTHPLIRHHYLALLTATPEARATHEVLKDYYLELAGDTPSYPTLADLQPLIEVVYHLCQAGAYDEAYKIHDERIIQKERFILMHQLGAFDTELSIMQMFFPQGVLAGEPQGSQAYAKSWILNMVGGCLMSLGRMGEAIPFYERKIEMQLSYEDWHNASRSYQNIADLQSLLGNLPASAAAQEALHLSQRAENKESENEALGDLAWAEHLQGEVTAAREHFQQAEALERESHSSVQYLYSLSGIQHADHLRRTGQAVQAQAVTRANLEICESQQWRDNWSKCHRVLGDIAAGEGDHPTAHGHYQQAVALARTISKRDVLIEALLGRGAWWAKKPDLTGTLRANLSGLDASDLALADLTEALDYATQGGYRIYEADIRNALAWAHHARGDFAAALASARQAEQLSAEMGYHWGHVDAAEVLAVLGK